MEVDLNRETSVEEPQMWYVLWDQYQGPCVLEPGLKTWFEGPLFFWMGCFSDDMYNKGVNCLG